MQPSLTFRFRFGASLLLAATLGVPAHAATASAPRTFALPGAVLLTSRDEVRSAAPALAQPLATLRAEADGLLGLKPASVMDKPTVAASGDKHDYFSLAPYWWPDPSKPNGLPYVQKDGRVNPTSRTGTDNNAFVKTCTAVETLALAFWYTGEERYAEKAATLVRVWFLDPATRMNPNLQHAQAIPGITDGRGIGLIEARHLIALTDGLALLDASAALTPADRSGMRAWLEAYYTWLTTSKNGKDEAAAENNHGSWYDAQAADLALVLGRTDDARRIIESAKTNRIAKQIEPDGSQPQELKRTRSLNYVLFNFEALAVLSRLGQHVGVDLWAFSTKDGRSLRAALGVIAPYADPGKAWLKDDLDLADRGRIYPLLIEGLRHVDQPEWRRLLKDFGTQPTEKQRWRLWTPLPTP